MTETVVVEKEAEKEVAPTYTPAEETAMENGWKPKEAWIADGGDPEEWIPARQFIKQGELFGRINSYKHKIQGLEKTVTTLVKHNEQVYEAGYKEALNSLRQERRVALQEGDVDRVEKVEEKIEELRETHQEETQQRKQEQAAAAPQMRPEFNEWAERNTWYGSDVSLSGYADGVAKEILADAKDTGVEVDYPKMLQEVSRKVRAKFPEKFGKQVSGPRVKDDGAEGARVVRKTDDVVSQMTDDERRIMDTIVRSGVKREDYLKQYKAVQHKKGR